VRLDGSILSFQFHINDKPYKFQGKVDGKSLEGSYRGEEASGKLRCATPAK